MTEEEIEHLWNKYNDEVKAELDYPHKSFSTDMFFKKLFKKCYADLLNQLTEKDKQIEELKGLKDVATLIKANGSTTVTLMELNNHLVSANQKIKDLEAQIEKMRTCEMCKNYNWQGCVFSNDKKLVCINNKRNLFELKE